MDKSYVLRESESGYTYDNAAELTKDTLRLVAHPIRLKMLKLLYKKPMYPAQLARMLKMHEQKVYYHINKLTAAGVLEVIERTEIRGTTARRIRPIATNLIYSIEYAAKNLRELTDSTGSSLMQFLHPFIKKGKLNCKIVVGSPDPHGAYKARARDGHYAIDLALFLGGLCNIGKEFCTRLDVDIDLEKKENLILVGGPVTNLTMSKINEHLPAKFSEGKPWGVVGREIHTDDNIGLIAKIPNPHFTSESILVVAGIRYGGTKSAVLALSRFSKLTLSRYTGQKEFYAIVQGYDLVGDGKIDSVELVE